MIGELKPRIVGIIVLVFLALIIFPWLFGDNQSIVFEDKHKHFKPQSNTKEQPNIEEATLPTVQRQPVNQQQVLGLPSESPVVQAEPIAHEKVSEEDMKVVSQNHTKLANIESAIIHSQTAASQVQIPKVTKQNKTIELKKPDFSRLKIAIKPSATKKASEATDKLWAIQLGSFSNQTNVDKLTKQLKAKHYPVYVRQIKNEKITKVFVGPLTKPDAAQKIQQIEKLTQVHGIVVKKSA